MKTEFAVLGKHISVASRSRRRWLVALTYSGLVALIVAWLFANAKMDTWWRLIFGVFCVAFILTFLLIAGSSDDPADEREKLRREYAYFVAYRLLGGMILLLLLAFFASFRGPNSIAPWVGPVLLMQSPSMVMLLTAAGALYITLPQAILMWTEPDIDADQAEVIRLWAKG